MSLFIKARDFVEQNRTVITRALLALVLAVVIVGWQVDLLKDILVSSGLLLVLILGFVMEISVTLSKYISERASVDERSSVQVARNEVENLDRLKTDFAKRAVHEVDMLEYSAHSVLPLIEDLSKQGASLRILIKDPATVGSFQRGRILASIDHLERFVLPGHETQVEIRCYQADASLRGRKVDNLLVDVGWYTPDISPKGVPGKMEIIGHLNPVMMCSVATDEGQRLREMFDRVFAALWASAESTDIRTVARLQEAEP